MSDTLRYSRKHMFLHWVIALLVAVQFFFAENMGAAFDAKLETASGGWTTGAAFHAIPGATIGLLMLWRLMIRRTTDIPPPPTHAPELIQTVSRATHWLFYAILIAMPVAGAIAWFFKLEWMAEVHDVTGKVLIALIVLHIAGAAYHHFIGGDKSVIHRMIPR
ncbi:hypothetical protein AN189_11915 [Loktanella sp. 3ANDIMAR09]|uniref:cytochrome b n=1 Tax=Loktanella sp. 3ANDIMAR09 TaxID=1225657 RepID=UPI0007072FA8|nr:cytochrome b/b6 domain-containing protein [Loktanella sp. 3ANDIMAR09]KQI68111.1 hypothetical protein AN189_11915 [Loktanella sp. 3ANDIMAR09]